MPKHTPLHAAHLASNARMVDFGGWQMPIHYGSQKQEHHLVRTSAGMFDVSHMTIVDIKGKEVEAFFIIDKNGNRTGMKVRDAEVNIQAEILRVLRKIPIMKPAVHNGKSVSVLCSLVLKYGNDIEVDVVYIPERPQN